MAPKPHAAIIERVSESDHADEMPACMAVVNPPLQVWIKINQVLPRGLDGPASDPAGVELRFEVLGTMTARVWRADGGWMG